MDLLTNQLIFQKWWESCRTKLTITGQVLQYSVSYISNKTKSGSSCELEMGDIVLIKEDFKIPRNVWMLGKVVELVKARDGKTRGAKLLTV